MKVLIRPVITEKTMAGAADSKFVFEVMPNVNKHQITQTIEEIYKVNVIKININKYKPEEKLIRGRLKSRIHGEKRAIVTLKKGQKIEGFEIKE
ncbi:TPA: 50S ribosomal protein L23 [Candidatus Berkelbacteria bacterium]|uniref:Large ribosomal subunit protein uL23 n=1 Tax=Berkelbacteria bacterium GW2011_GWE1_39_12 TaxID=1618337 RepID=A0A0G4B6N7_9BACT|nr:MAG: 50S ribosomal protein L25, large subunit ribosomal protein L23 [Berkelbacteria bacterium GW2011_GWE1_39_12]HBO60226.1 50S ribosomal protein L23 [Candidatus Berkelbacteria bacterium]